MDQLGVQGGGVHHQVNGQHPPHHHLDIKTESEESVLPYKVLLQ